VKLLHKQEVLKRLSRSNENVRVWVDKGLFPPPIKVSSGQQARSYWLEREVSQVTAAIVLGKDEKYRELLTNQMIKERDSWAHEQLEDFERRA